MSAPPDLQTKTGVRVLLVEDDPADATRLEAALAACPEPPFEVERASGVEDALRRLRDGRFHAVLLDLSLEEGEGLDTLARARVAAAAVPIIVMTAQQDEELALRALRFGAQDYLAKGEYEDRLVQRTVRHAVERHRILTDLALARQHEHYLATHDALTGLPNRLAFMDQLRRSISWSARSGKQLAVLFLDLDRFKQINDSLGHPIGDDLLKITADRVSGVMRKSDMVARLGGDEFIVMLHDVQRDYDPGRVAQKLTEAITAPCMLDGREYRVTGSIGIALYPRDGSDPDLLIRNADTAMYHAKAEGLNRFSHYAEGMNRIVTRRLDVENGLRRACAESAFELHYQPQVDAALGLIVGAEALVRWRHPERGLVPPSEFIAIAEETEMIYEIGEWALREGCRQTLGWRTRDGRPVKLSVNVSTRQLADPGFSELVSRILRESGFEPNRLVLEITEGSVLEERGVTLATVQRLRKLGVRIYIDDFGTGYSALSALKHLPVDGIKIDRSFVTDITARTADATITQGLIGIARGLGLEAIAEGVETREQLEFLYGLGCPLLQGYLFAKPAAAAEFEAALAADPPSWHDAIPDPGR